MNDDKVDRKQQRSNAKKSLREPLLDPKTVGEDSSFWVLCNHNNNKQHRSTTSNLTTCSDTKNNNNNDNNTPQHLNHCSISDDSLGLEDVLRSWYEQQEDENNPNNSNSNNNTNNTGNDNNDDNNENDVYHSQRSMGCRIPWYRHPLQIMAMISNFSTSFNVVNISLVLPILRNLKTSATAGMEIFHDYDEYNNDNNIMETILGVSSAQQQQHAQEESLVASALLAGMILGQIMGGALGDSCLGLAGALAAVMVLQTVASIGSAAVPLHWLLHPNENNNHHDEDDFYWRLANWRFILGVGAGAVYPLAACLSVESQSAHSSSCKDHEAQRIKRVVWTFAMQGIGFCAVPALATALILVGHVPLVHVWRILLGAGAVPGLVLLYLQYRLFVEPFPTATVAATALTQPLLLETNEEIIAQQLEQTQEQQQHPEEDRASHQKNNTVAIDTGAAEDMEMPDNTVSTPPAEANNTTPNYDHQVSTQEEELSNPSDKYNDGDEQNHTTPVGMTRPATMVNFATLEPENITRSVSCPVFPARNTTSPIPLSPRSEYDHRCHQQREQENTGMTDRELHDDSDGEVGTFLDSSPDLDMSSAGVFRESEPPVINTGWWISLQTEEGLFRKLMGTAVTWFLFDVLFYGNTLFQPVVIEQAFGSRTHMAPDALIRRVALDSLVLNSVSLPGYFVAALLIGKKTCGITQSPRYVMTQGFVGMAVVYLAIGLAWDELLHYPILLIFVYGLTFFFANYGPNTTTFILPSLVYSAECRSTFNGLSAACGKLGALVGATIFPPLITSIHEKGVMKLCAAVALLALVMTVSFVRLRQNAVQHPAPGRGRLSVVVAAAADPQSNNNNNNNSNPPTVAPASNESA